MMIHHPAYFTYDPKHGGAYYFAPEYRTSPPYREQRQVSAILDIASDGTLAGVELVMGGLPPPPSCEPVRREPPPMIPSAEKRIAEHLVDFSVGTFVFVRGTTAVDLMETAYRDGFAAADGRAEQMIEALRSPSEENIEIIAQAICDASGRLNYVVMACAALRAAADMFGRAK